MMNGASGSLSAIALMLTVGLVRSTPVWAQGPFADVPPNHLAAAAVNELAKQGVLQGFADGLYRGGRPVTRYEAVMAVSRLVQQPLMRDPTPSVWPDLPILGPLLKDVPDTHWAAQDVDRLRRWGIIAGYPDATFRGNQVITEGELAVILRRLRAFAERFMDLELEQQRKGNSPASLLLASQ